MAKTTQEYRVSLTRKEVEDVIKRELEKKFYNASINITFNIGSEYTDDHYGEHTVVVREVVAIVSVPSDISV